MHTIGGSIHFGLSIRNIGAVERQGKAVPSSAGAFAQLEVNEVPEFEQILTEESLGTHWEGKQLKSADQYLVKLITKPDSIEIGDVRNTTLKREVTEQTQYDQIALLLERMYESAHDSQEEGYIETMSQNVAADAARKGKQFRRLNFEA